MCQLCETAKSLSKIREDKEKGTIILVFEGFDLVEVHKSYFKVAKDFRDYPKIMDEVLSTWGGSFKFPIGKGRHI